MNTALKIAPTARQAAAAKFRQLADRLENGDLDGARIQWRDGLDHVEVVEVEIADAEGKAEVRLYKEQV